MHYLKTMFYLATFKQGYICILSWPISTSPTSAPQVCAASGRLSLSVLRRYFPAATGFAHDHCPDGILSPITASNSETKTILVHLLLRPGFRGASWTHLSSEQDQFHPGGTGKEALEVGDDAKVQATYQNILPKAVIKQSHCVYMLLSSCCQLILIHMSLFLIFNINISNDINNFLSAKVTSIES